MISFGSLDKIEKQKNPAEIGDTQQCAEDFAALFSVPVERTNDFVNKSADSNENSFNETSLNKFETDFHAALTTQTSSAEISLTQNINRQDFTAESEIFAAESPEEFINLKTLSIQNQTDLQSKNNSFETGKEIFSSNVESLIKAGIESGRIEILDNSQKIPARDLFQNDSSEKAALLTGEKSEISKKLSEFLGEISNLFKNEYSVEPKQIESFPDCSFETNNMISETDVSFAVAQTKPTAAFGESEAKFSQTQVETSKPEKQPKPDENMSVAGFNKVLPALSKDSKTVETIAQTPARTSEVLEQIEPQVLQLLTLNNVKNEKKVMKMRLHPAELGTIEIKLEKNVSGKLIAHFQTENEATRQILADSLEQLRGSLQNSGWQIERLEISCRAFSSNGQADRENQSRQFETVENRLNNKTASEQVSAAADDLKSNRLLSVRA